MPDCPEWAALARLTASPEVQAAQGEARGAAARLRWHPALRHHGGQAVAEACLRAASASAALEGAEMPLALVRRLNAGAPWPSVAPVAGPARPSAAGVAPGRSALDAAAAIVRAAIRATLESERVAAMPAPPPFHMLARLHAAAGSGLLPTDEVGRPRVGAEHAADLQFLPPAPLPAQLPASLTVLSRVLTAPPTFSALVVAAVAHAEVVRVRPFTALNALTARAAQRAVLRARGLDVTGLVVADAGHEGDRRAYAAALTAYAGSGSFGTQDWLTAAVGWVVHCCQAVSQGAREGAHAADDVLAAARSRADPVVP